VCRLCGSFVRQVLIGQFVRLVVLHIREFVERLPAVGLKRFRRVGGFLAGGQSRLVQAAQIGIFQVGQFVGLGAAVRNVDAVAGLRRLRQVAVVQFRQSFGPAVRRVIKVGSGIRLV